MKTSIKVSSLIAATAVCVLLGGGTSAQQPKSGAESQSPPKAAEKPAAVTGSVKAPDITGKWLHTNGSKTEELTIRETSKGPEGFHLELDEDKSNKIFLRWDADSERFCGENSLPNRVTVRVRRNGKTLLITNVPQFEGGALLRSKEAITVEWIRPPDPSEIKIFHLQHADSRILKETLENLLSKEYPSFRATAVSSNNSLIVTGEEEVLMKTDALLRALDEPQSTKPASTGKLPAPTRANSESNQLLEQLRVLELGVQEEAQKLRQIEAEKQDQQKLKTLLSQALDLKLQAEEAQVQELRAKLERLQTQIATRKEKREKIVARRANELLGADATTWTPENIRKKLRETAAKKSVIERQHTDPERSIPKESENQNAGPSSPMGTTQNSSNFEDIVQIQAELDYAPSAEHMHKRRDRILELRKLVGELEVRHYKDRSKPAELQSAIDELRNVRNDYKKQLRKIQSIENLYLNHNLRQRLTALQKVSESETGLAAKNSAREMEVLRQVVNRIEAFGPPGSESAPWGLEDNTPFATAVLASSQTSELHPDAAKALFERSIGLGLELVTFDELKLPFKAALRVREAIKDRKPGDLIVMINGQLFHSWPQAVEALRVSAGPGAGSSPNTLVLRGGLTGDIIPIDKDAYWDEDYAKSGSPLKALANFEVRLRDGSEVQTQYFCGIFLSPDGLAVIPVPSASLAMGEDIVLYNAFTGTAEVVESDEEHGLTLVKVKARDKQLFNWMKCRVGLPAKGQSLNNAGSPTLSTVLITGQPYPKPLSATDAFVVERNEDGNLMPGSMYISKDGCVQGIKTIWPYMHPSDQSVGSQPGAIGAATREWAIPAVHIENLLNKYRPQPQ